MRTIEIVVGGVYHDSKIGVREVVTIEVVQPPSAAAPRVTYRILSAKVEQEYSYDDQKMVSVIGTTSSCELASFASWAKVKVGDGAREQLLTELTARKLRLPPGEKAFMESLGDEYVDCSISFEFNETRQARGVEKKGLVTVDEPRAGTGGEVKLTALGVAWMHANAKAAVAAKRKGCE